jgi:hypothetical protein
VVAQPELQYAVLCKVSGGVTGRALQQGGLVHFFSSLLIESFLGSYSLMLETYSAEHGLWKPGWDFQNVDWLRQISLSTNQVRVEAGFKSD